VKPAPPEALLDARRILVCVGAGGVGKTTLSAALGLEAARRGRRALVLTIDPARRLADALGVEVLDGAARPMPRERLAALGVPEEGALFAMMLDVKGTLDGLVERFAEDEETKRRILENRIYQHVSDALAGSAEYSAMEKVYEISRQESYDLIVVDTPPSQHALDFLESPQRLLEFIDSRIVKLLLHPAFSAGRFGFRVFHRSAQKVLQLVERVSGFGFLEDISDFLLAFEGMAEGFKARARNVESLLLGPQSAFVLATGATGESAHHGRTLLARLEAARVPLAGVVVNRVRTWPGAGGPPESIPPAGHEAEARRALAEALAGDAGAEDGGFPAEAAADAAIEAARRHAAVVRRHAEACEALRRYAERGGLFWRQVPELPRDVHDLDGLGRIADHVFRPARATASDGARRPDARSGEPDARDASSRGGTP
jgi:anion-transporting  ArsA/GET3 family ATPase